MYANALIIFWPGVTTLHRVPLASGVENVFGCSALLIQHRKGGYVLAFLRFNCGC